MACMGGLAILPGAASPVQQGGPGTLAAAAMRPAFQPGAAAAAAAAPHAPAANPAPLPRLASLMGAIAALRGVSGGGTAAAAASAAVAAPPFRLPGRASVRCCSSAASCCSKAASAASRASSICELPYRPCGARAQQGRSERGWSSGECSGRRALWHRTAERQLAAAGRSGARLAVRRHDCRRGRLASWLLIIGFAHLSIHRGHGACRQG